MLAAPRWCSWCFWAARLLHSSLGCNHYLIYDISNTIFVIFLHRQNWNFLHTKCTTSPLIYPYMIRLPSLVIGYLVLTRRHLHSLFSISTAVAHIVTGLYIIIFIWIWISVRCSLPPPNSWSILSHPIPLRHHCYSHPYMVYYLHLYSVKLFR